MAERDGSGRSLLVQTRGLLHRFGLKARKGLGQHFLVDGAVLGLITGAAELTPADIVVEVGPGLGVLTRELAREAGRVVSIELDEKLAHVLKETLASCDNVTIIDGNVLHIDPAALLDEQRAHFSQVAAAPSGYKVVANLPYYITAPALRHFLEAPARPELMVVMVQKEVAEAIAAGPGKMSLMSVSVQFYGEPEVVSYVPARCFYPVPEVDSAILRIRPYPHPVVAVTDREGFFRLVRAGFSASRKQLANSLGQGLALPKAEVLALLEEAGIDPRRRAEALSLDEWTRLWQVVTRAGGLAC